MRKRFLLSMILLALGTMAVAQQKDQAALSSLVEAERGFCKASVANGIREAFIANLADDATLFRPHAVAGKKWMIEQPARPGLLTWEPIFADVSGAGDLGYTTGPWEFRKNGPTDKEVAHGNYVTIWKKQPGGAWKAVLDTGISNPPPTSKTAGLQTSAMKKAAAKIDSVDIQSARAALINQDREFSKSSAERGIVNAYDSYLSDDARVFRDNQFPLTGKRAAHAHLAALKGTLTWQPAKADVSSAGDLGYTFGTAELKGAGTDKTDYSNYVRIWKKQAGAWKVVLDVMNSAPPPSAASPSAGSD
jgi:ketosteroid isomerase-like protein